MPSLDVLRWFFEVLDGTLTLVVDAIADPVE